MDSMKIKIYVFAILVLTASCYKEVVTFESEPNKELQLPSIIKFDGKEVFLDTKLNMIRFPVVLDSTNNFSAFTSFRESSKVRFENLLLQNNKVNEFGTVEIGKSYTLTVEYGEEVSKFEFVFTNLPVFQLITDTKIWDEPKSLARMVIAAPEKEGCLTSYAGVEYRGQSSRYLDKKSIGFSLWQTMTSSSEYSARLLGLKSNSDWILNGAAIDPSGIRNLISMTIWGNIVKKGSANNESHIGVNVRLAEVFVNNKCQGFYVFSEHINHEFLEAAPGDVLYKAIDWAGGAAKFENFNPDVSPNCFWNGWEQIVPDCGEHLDWKPLIKLYEVVTTPEDAVFKQNISRLIDVDNFIDYYLFLNLIFAGDNTGKNVFLYKKYSDGLFQIIPWDLDGSWGIAHDGLSQGYEGILTNALYQRLFETNAENFTLKVKDRWDELRKTLFDESQLNYQFNQYFQILNESGIINVENNVWGKNLDLKHQHIYIQTWMANRIAYLDLYFSKL